VVVPVPAADRLVRQVRRTHAAAAAPRIPAHVTVLYPFLQVEAVDAAVCAALAAICAAEPAFDVVLRRCGRFPSVLWLDPEPAEPFRRLTRAVAARWPQLPPYGGQWPDPVPHLTVVDLDEPERLRTAEQDLVPRLPVQARVAEVQLLAFDGERFACRARLPLG
jgi:2'-5' RNA ligase